MWGSRETNGYKQSKAIVVFPNRRQELCIFKSSDTLAIQHLFIILKYKRKKRWGVVFRKKQIAMSQKLVQCCLWEQKEKKKKLLRSQVSWNVSVMLVFASFQLLWPPRSHGQTLHSQCSSPWLQKLLGLYCTQTTGSSELKTNTLS